MKATTWNAPGCGVVIAFAALGQVNVSSLQDAEHGIACRDALRGPKRERFERFREIERTNSFLEDEAFDRLVAALDADEAVIVLPNGAFNWLRSKVEPYAVSVPLASAKKRLLASLAAAKEGDVEVAT